MHLAEIKAAVSQLNSRELSELANWIKTLACNPSPRFVETQEAIQLTNQQKGDLAEIYITQLVSGVRMRVRSKFDVEAANGKQLEIKYSKLSTPRGAGGTAYNWTWARPLGAEREKSYDQLILLGEPNPKCLMRYKEPECQYVLFDIPFLELPSVMDVKNNQIVLNSDPSVIWASKEKLVKIYSFQVTSDELSKRYCML